MGKEFQVHAWRKPLFRPGRLSALAALVVVLVAVPATGLASGAVPGTWRRLPAAPIVPDDSRLVSVWTGTKLLVFGRAQLTAPWSVNVAAVYSPTAGTWRRLTPPRGDKGNYEGQYRGVWTGTDLLVIGPTINHAFNPVTNRWRRISSATAPVMGATVVWTGREMIAWGGGCCGDASSDGTAYNPKTNTWRKLAASPVAPSQSPMGAWDGHELILLVNGLDPDGKPYPAELARAAAYNPATDTWRRIAPPPAPRSGATAVWDGREVLLVGGTGASEGAKPPALARAGFAYNPATNRWRQLPPMGSGRRDAAMVWTGRRLLVWGGSQTAGAGLPVAPNRGLAYDPTANRWSPLPGTPLLGRLDPTAVWTGRSMIVWGGQRPNTPLGSGTRFFADGAVFTPATP